MTTSFHACFGRSSTGSSTKGRLRKLLREMPMLTEREQELLRTFIQTGFRAPETAEAIYETYPTTKRLLSLCMRKLKAPTWAAAAYQAEREGLI